MAPICYLGVRNNEAATGAVTKFDGWQGSCRAGTESGDRGGL